MKRGLVIAVILITIVLTGAMNVQAANYHGNNFDKMALEDQKSLLGLELVNFPSVDSLVEVAENARELPLPAAGLLFGPAVALLLGMGKKRNRQD